MAKHKEEKTNVMRILDQKKIPYTARYYDTGEGPEGTREYGAHVAAALGQDPTPQDIAFHKQIAQCTQNQVLPNLIPVISESIRAFSHLQPPMKVRSTILAHRDIYEAIAARSPSRARDAMNIHLAEALRKLRKSRLKEDDED